MDDARLVQRQYKLKLLSPRSIQQIEGEKIKKWSYARWRMVISKSSWCGAFLLDLLSLAGWVVVSKCRANLCLGSKICWPIPPRSRIKWLDGIECLFLSCLLRLRVWETKGDGQLETEVPKVEDSMTKRQNYSSLGGGDIAVFSCNMHCMPSQRNKNSDPKDGCRGNERAKPKHGGV